MLRPKNIGLVNQRRTLRALYAQSQAYPYAAQLSATALTATNDQSQLVGADGATGTALIWPGAVMELVNAAGVVHEKVKLSDPEAVGRPFGLSANFVGGNMDEINGVYTIGAFSGNIGVWRGRGGVFEVLAPLFVSGIGA